MVVIDGSLQLVPDYWSVGIDISRFFCVGVVYSRLGLDVDTPVDAPTVGSL